MRLFAFLPFRGPGSWSLRVFVALALNTVWTIVDQASLYNQLAALLPLPLRCNIKKIEYKVVKHDIRVGTRLTGNDFSDSFVQLLAAHGQEGWDLKSVIREGGFMTLLIFAREVN